MDKGAHFFKCDFQVHTPRDVRWVGNNAITPEERKIYAEELILACRLKGLSAIAVTDHHDFAFYPYIKKSAHDELDDSGNSIPENKKIVVFPGIELTLTAPNCQALLILDADFPGNLLSCVLTALSISPASDGDSKHAAVQRIPQTVVNNLTDLYEKLSSHEELKNRFIVLPNVSETGHGTMLRSGFGDFYKNMPCVGGYTDGQVSRFGTGNLSIVNGLNRDYGFKSIAVFQTSDNRKRNHIDLGKHTTWVKWSEPTAEALRQACLAKESRMSHNEPELPNLWINSISVSNSKFLGRVEIDFNRQYNAIIGGRGTGKSTILEYLRWGLCDQPVENYDTEIAPVQTKRKKLIDDTLQKYDGEVHVTFLLNEIKHIVKRNSKSQEISLKIGDADFVQTTEQEVRNLLPIQAYSQKQLSSVGIRVEELKRFVELPVKKTIDQIRSDIRDTATKIVVTYNQLMRKKEIETEINKYNLEIVSLKKQLEKLRAGLKGLSDKDRAIINQKTKYDNEEIVINSLKNELERIRELADTLKTEAGGDLEKQEETEFINADLIREIRSQFVSKFSEIKKQIAFLSGLFEEVSLKIINKKLTAWEKLKSDFDKKYEAAKAKAKVNQQLLNQIQAIEKRIVELRKLQQENHNALTELGNPETEYKVFRKKWNTSHEDKIKVLDGQCQQFSSLSSGLIKAEITKSLDIDLLKQKLKVAFSSMNIKEQKLDDLCKCVLDADNPLTTWNGILLELERLAFYSVEGPDPTATYTYFRWLRIY